MKVLKHLHKFFNRSSTPWVQLVWDNYYTRGRLPQPSPRGSFWWRDILKLLDSFKGLSLVSLKDGASCLFRHDLWEGRILSQAFPERHSFAKKPKNFSSSGNFNSFATNPLPPVFVSWGFCSISRAYRLSPRTSDAKWAWQLVLYLGVINFLFKQGL